MEACNLESAREAQQPEQSQADAGSCSGDSRTVLTYLTFLEQKIGHLRGIVSSTPRPPRQIVSAELSCIAVQLVSISNSLAASTGAEDDAKSPPPPPCAATPDEADSSDASDDHDHHAYDDDRYYEVIELDKEEILARHVHCCKVCGKGFKRDANLRMHMRGHGDEYKTAAALAKPAPPSSSPPAPTRCFYSCPYVGCKRNREHKSFQPLKTAVCVRNHYRRSHCDKSFTCRRCGVKRFSVLADLRTHEKHCGRDRWVCSCGTSFSRKDKLFGHVAAFDGHAPALPPEEEGTADHRDDVNGTGNGSDQMLMDSVSRMASMEGFSDSMFDGFSCADIKGFSLGDGQYLDDGRGFLDSCDYDGLDLFGAPGISVQKNEE